MIAVVGSVDASSYLTSYSQYVFTNPEPETLEPETVNPKTLNDWTQRQNSNNPKP